MVVTSHPALLLHLGDALKCGMNGRMQESATGGKLLDSRPPSPGGPRGPPPHLRCTVLFALPKLPGSCLYVQVPLFYEILTHHLHLCPQLLVSILAPLPPFGPTH